MLCSSGAMILGSLMANKSIPQVYILSVWNNNSGTMDDRFKCTQGAATTIWACLNPYVEESTTEEGKLRKFFNKMS